MSTELESAHPRVGGENQRLARLGVQVKGSSPRGRGKRYAVDQVDLLGGLIPAWAGKTRTRRSSASGLGAHPRVGGENNAPRP